MMEFINQKLEEDDELTASRLKNMLLERWPELRATLDTIKRWRRKIGWVCTRPHYCQLVRNLIRRKLKVVLVQGGTEVKG